MWDFLYLSIVKQKIKYLFTACCYLLGIISFHAQNLVPNPSFEDTVHCPNNANELYDTQYWINPTGGTPDYFNACSTANTDAVHVPNNGYGSQSAHTGVAYAGFYAFNKSFPNFYREYIQVALTSTLISNHKYIASFYLSLAEESQYADDNIGAYFSINQISSSNSNPLTTFTPQIQSKPAQLLSDKINWMLVSDTLTAQGGEQYITIGNFMKDSLSDTLFLGNSGGGNVTYYYIDDVSVIDVATMSIKQEIVSNNQLSVYPNPTSQTLNITITKTTESSNTIKLIDVTGQTVYNNVMKGANEVIDISELAKGVYMLIVTDDNNTSYKKVIVE